MASEEFLDLNQYEKKEKIGEGSFGKVYIVEDKSSKQLYAAKVSIKDIMHISHSNLRDIYREINILSHIQHPSILKFIGYSPNNFKNKSKPVIITEFSTNGSLGNILDLERNQQQIPGWNETKKLICIYGIAKGMSYLHSHKILHRDLKPENIFLDDYLFPKIADFGLSKFNDDKTLESFSTSGIKGTPVYIAPEIWNNQAYTEASDVYAYSLIVYEIVTNEKPFSDLGFSQILIDVCIEGKRPEIMKNVPECYKNLIKSCWSQSPNDRPRFNEIVEQLKTNSSFIYENIQQDDYLSYIEYIEKAEDLFDSFEKKIHISELKNIEKVAINRKRKIIEDQKIMEDEEELIKYQPKIISKHEFNELKYSCKKLIINAETEKDPNSSLHLVSKSFIEGVKSFPKNIEIGIKYLEYGLKEKDIKTMELYGKLLFEGNFLVKNEEKAVEIFTELAIKFNNPIAKLELAKIILSHQSYNINDSNENINYFDAKRLCKESADEGNIDAMLLYAELSRKEKNNRFGKLHCDQKEAYNYIKKASDLGDPRAMVEYGRILETGRALNEINKEEAVKLYQKAYEKKDISGCFNFGVCLYEGIGGLVKNKEIGKKLIDFCVDKNFLPAILYNSQYFIQDKKEKFEIYKKLANLGLFNAYLLTGECYMKGQGIKKNPHYAIKYFKRSVEEGCPGAAYFIGLIYYEGNIEFGIQKNTKKAEKYIKYASDNGCIDAMPIYAGILAENGGCYSEVKKYYKLGIHLCHTGAMCQYAARLKDGNGVPKNLRKAAKYYKMAADKGDKIGMLLYSAMVQNGEGVDQDNDESIRYKLLYSDQNNENCLIS